MERILIKDGRVVDAQTKRDGILDILIENGRIRGIEKNIQGIQGRIIHAKGFMVTPGFIDMHVHLREPGFEYKETFRSGTLSAAAGGFTTVACMPNTQPPIDNAPLVEYIRSKAKKEGLVKVLPIGAISKGLKGKELAPLGEMADAGAVAFSDDGYPVGDCSLMKKAMEYAAIWGTPILSHCEESTLSQGGLMNEGEMSTKLGMAGIPSAAEEIMVARDIALAKYTGCPVHITHVSTAYSVEIIRRAKEKGIPITAEATPHHFSLTDGAVDGYDSATKVNPPLRDQRDVEAVKQGLQEGTIDVIATDHAPHHRDEKCQEYQLAPFGISGLETALPLVITKLLRKKYLTPLQLVERMSLHPARILNLDAGCLEVGRCADITIIDPEKEILIDREQFYSKGKNTPFHGMKLFGEVVYTIVNGMVVKDRGEIKGGKTNVYGPID